jgi:hypothetical protein
MKPSRPFSLPLAILVAVLPAGGCAPRDPPAPATDLVLQPAPVDPGSAPTASSDEAQPAPGAVDSGEDPSIPKPPPLTPIGVPECDRFVDKYVVCVDRHVPADQKERVMRDLHIHRARWRELQKMQDGKLAAGLSCRGVAQRLKGDLTVDYGCEF